MPNTFNYASNTAILENQYSRYSVSRIIENPLQDLLEIELPLENQETYFIEMTLYSLANNSVVFNTRIDPTNNDEVVKTVTLTYPDTSVRRLLVIDFSKVIADIPDGRFEAVFNFFTPKIGNSVISPLTLTKISPSGTEVELQLLPEYKTQESASILTDFASPQINHAWVLQAMQYICNQTQSLDTNIPTDQTALSFGIIQQFLPTAVSAQLNNPNTSGVFTSSLQLSTQTLLNNTYNYATQSIQTYISENVVFTDKTLIEILSSSLSTAYANYAQNTRYTLL